MTETGTANIFTIEQQRAFFWQLIRNLDKLRNSYGGLTLDNLGSDIEMVSEEYPGDFYRARVRLYTVHHSYTITGTATGEGGTLSCVMLNRAPLPGENHPRGRDMPSGPLNLGTWAEILGSIVAFEMIILTGGVGIDRDKT